MMRLRFDALERGDGRYRFLGEPFSGIGFDTQVHGAIEAFEIVNGTVTAAYRPLGITALTVPRQIDVTGRLKDDENDPRPLEGEDDKFSGVGYEFEGPYCLHELVFDRGEVVSDTWLRKDGTLLSHDRKDVYRYYFEWFASGKLKSTTVSGADSLYVDFSFTEDQHLKFLSIQGPFFSVLPSIAAGSGYFPITSKESMAALRAGPSLFLGASGVDDALVQFMVSSGVLEATTTLRFDNANISESTSLALEGLANLNEVQIESSVEGQRSIVVELLKRRPDLSANFVLTQTYNQPA